MGFYMLGPSRVFICYLIGWLRRRWNETNSNNSEELSKIQPMSRFVYALLIQLLKEVQLYNQWQHEVARRRKHTGNSSSCVTAPETSKEML
jgi:hypothetical protein